MQRHSLRLLLAGIATSGFAVGCADQSSDPTGPEPTLAPLVSKVPGGKYIEGAYIVVLKPSVREVDGPVDEISQRFKIKSKFRYKHAIKGFAGQLPASVVDALRADPRVAYIEQDQVAHVVTTTQPGATWGLDRIDQRTRPLSTTYSYDQTGAGVDAYILDTGIRFTHTEFGGRAVTGYDAITAGGTAADGNGHGTHVAGTVGGTTYGVAKGVRLIAVRVLNNSGSGAYSQVIAGVDWVTSNHTSTPAVANMSLGGPVSTALDDAVRRSIVDGVTYSVSAGNGSANASTQSPAKVAEAITVGATDMNDGFASFSNFGAGLDISGPGVSITSSWFTSDAATNTISGTSMSSPHVAGTAALYLEANPTATPAQVSAALADNATPGAITGIPTGTPNRLLFSSFGPPPPAPAAPTLVSPAAGATGVTVPATLTWSASTGATSYRVQVSTSSGFGTLAANQSVTGTSTSVSGLAGSTLYYWRVSATNGGGTSGWSEPVQSFTTATAPPAAPPAPTLQSPANRATGVAVPVTLTWNAAARATSYRVQVSRSSSFGTLVRDVSGITDRTTSVSGLAARTRYYWRVNASNAGGTSAWSASRRFTTR